MAHSISNGSCPSGESTPTLFFFGPDGGGTLKLALDGDSTIMSVKLKGRHARILLALNDALRMDEHLDEPFRGWMTDAKLAEAYCQGDPLMPAPSPEAIASYRCQINRLARQETPPGSTPPKLFDSQRGGGVRLAQEIAVIDLNQR